MAKFRATIEGSRGEASRLGTAKSGLRASINGWNIGIDVYLRYDEKLGCDCVYVALTGGSNGGRRETLLYTNELALTTERHLTGTR